MQILVMVHDVDKQIVLERHIEQQGHVACPTDNGARGLEVIANSNIDMVICSPLLPDMNGFEFIQKTRQLDLNRYLFVAMLIDQDDHQTMAAAFAKGADDIIAWPSNESLLMATMINAGRIIALESESTQKLSAIKRNHSQVVTAFAGLIETFSGKLGAHCRRVGDLALSMANMHPDIAPEDYAAIEACGRLHDIGMIGLPLSIVDKRRIEFTGEETALYRTHPQRGAAVLNHIDMFRPVARLIRMHHEQFNGRGFPDELAGDEIPLGAAIVGAASLYDDLIFQEHVGRQEAASHLQHYRGYQLAPVLVDILLEINLSLLQADARKNYKRCHVIDLEEGMLLARGILTKTGACVMSAGTLLEPALITRLKRYYESGNIIDSVFIRK